MSDQDRRDRYLIVSDIVDFQTALYKFQRVLYDQQDLLSEQPLTAVVQIHLCFLEELVKEYRETLCLPRREE